MAPDTAGSPTKLVSPSKRSTPGPTSAVNLHLISARTTPTAKRIVRTLDRESESSLSDLGEGDSEAETERLHISPQKPRQKVILQHSNNVTTSTELPAEMSVDEEATVAPEDDSNTPDYSVPPSPTTRSPSKKRKREEIGSPSHSIPQLEPGTPSTTPPKKKLHTPDDDNAAPENGLPKNEVGAISNGESESTKDTLTNGTTEAPLVSIATVPTDKPGDKDLIAEDADQELPSPQKDGIDDDNQNLSIGSPQGEPADDAAVDPAREEDEDAERDLRRKQAMDELAEIERVFAQLKDSLYSERLHRVELEMKLLTEGRHPEYLAQKVCIDQRLEEKIRLANAQYKYAMESLDIATNVSKAQLHSQYYQRTREIRQDTLYSCSEELYNITRERRVGDSLVPEYTYRIPERHSTRVKQRQQYNWEVIVLSGMAKSVGFPAAPDVSGVTEEEMVDDLEAMGISRVPARLNASIAPPNMSRFDDGYDRLTPVHWSQSHPSPPSPVSAFSTHQHAHLHRHHHHHHRQHTHVTPQGPSRLPSQLQEHVQYPPRRTNSFNSQAPPNVPLSSLLSEGAVKMEAQPGSSSFIVKSAEPFGAPPPFHGDSQQSPHPPQSNALGNHSHPFARPQSTDALASRSSPQAKMRDVSSPAASDLLMNRGPGSNNREHGMEPTDLRKLKDTGPSSADGFGGGLAGPLRFGTGRVGGYS